MMIKAGARSTAILVAGLFVVLADPSLAATGADDATTAGTMIVAAADQLNDVDRSLREGSPLASPPPNPPSVPATAASRESSTWDQTSLIGKIFIALGVLLTMASAARMFMA
jgi:hypothetical protein